MITSPQEWVRFLQHTDPLMGVPLVVIGMVVMMFGHRMHKVCIALSAAFAGYCLGIAFAPGTDVQMIVAPGLAVALAAVSLGPAQYAAALLGGAASSYLFMQIIGSMGLDGAAWWIAWAVMFLGFSALCAINRPMVVVLISAVGGALLFTSGGVALIRFAPGIYNNMQGMAKGSAIVLPFLMLVPTAMSFFYQMGEVRRTGQSL